MRDTYGSNFIRISPYGEIRAIERYEGESLLDMLYDTIGCELIEVVHISIKGKPYIMIVDEEAWLQSKPIVNHIATCLTSDYRLDRSMIAGVAAICSTCIDENGEHDICGLTYEETKSVIDTVKVIM